MSVLFYRRPDYVSPISGPINASDCAKYVERARGSESSIPAGLSFEEVIKNKPLPPCSLNDFMDYLVYVEHSAENLQFYLWYQDYERRWTALPASQRALSPEVRPDQSDFPSLNKQKSFNAGDRMPTTRPKVMAESWSADGLSFFLDEEGTEDAGSIATNSIAMNSLATTGVLSDADIAAQAGLKWQPFTVQANREECNNIVRHYLALHSPRELNLSHRDRVLVLHALQHTTHPSAFAPALKVAETTLRGQSHPNFIRWSICNGNKPRIVFVRSLGVANIVAGFYVAVALTLSHVSRYYRIFAFIPWMIGFTTIVAAYKGLCIILHHSHTRNLRPWELDRSESRGTVVSERRLSNASSAGGRTTKLSSRMKSYDDEADTEVGASTPTSMSTFGPKNSYEQERWVAEYEKKPLLKKVFHEKGVWTQEETLRLLQDKIVIGAYLWGAIITIPLTIVFTALPMGNFF